jgi:hypothetical protein
MEKEIIYDIFKIKLSHASYFFEKYLHYKNIIESFDFDKLNKKLLLHSEIFIDTYLSQPLLIGLNQNSSSLHYHKIHTTDISILPYQVDQIIDIKISEILIIISIYYLTCSESRFKKFKDSDINIVFYKSTNNHSQFIESIRKGLEFIIYFKKNKIDIHKLNELNDVLKINLADSILNISNRNYYNYIFDLEVQSNTLQKRTSIHTAPKKNITNIDHILCSSCAQEHSKNDLIFEIGDYTVNYICPVSNKKTKVESYKFCFDKEKSTLSCPICDTTHLINFENQTKDLYFTFSYSYDEILQKTDDTMQIKCSHIGTIYEDYEKFCEIKLKKETTIADLEIKKKIISNLQTFIIHKFKFVVTNFNNKIQIREIYKIE